MRPQLPIPRFLERLPSLCLCQNIDSRFSETTTVFRMTQYNHSRISGRAQNLRMIRKTDSRYLERLQSLCSTQSTDSRISGIATESLFDPNCRFQNFWNDHRISVCAKMDILEYLERLVNLCLIHVTTSRIFSKDRRISFLPEFPIPEFLKRPQNLCLTQITDSRISGTTTESLFDPNLNNWNHQRISVWPKLPIPESLERPQNLCLTQITNSRNSGEPTESLCDQNYRFQNFWNDFRISYCAKKYIPDFLKRPQTFVWPNTTIPEYLKRAQNLCMIQNTDYGIPGRTKEPLFDPNHHFQNLLSDHRISVRLTSRISGTTT
jgi:hypothetical protein